MNKETKEIYINKIEPELAKMGIKMDKAKPIHIQSKDGVHLFRINLSEHSYVLKYFEKDEYLREIDNYEMLSGAEVKTIDVIAKGERSLLLCDIEQSEKYRLGRPEDLRDAQVASKIAFWYKDLHDKGESMSGLENLYCETDEITLNALYTIKSKTSISSHDTLDLMIANFDKLQNMIDGFRKTLNYNDFYWTNLIVAKDKGQAFMFDYNLLGRGYRYSDIRNVCSSLGEEAKEAFLLAYGGYNLKEKEFDEAISHIVNLIFAFRRSEFPSWATRSINMLEDGILLKALENLLADS